MNKKFFFMIFFVNKRKSRYRFGAFFHSAVLLLALELIMSDLDALQCSKHSSVSVFLENVIDRLKNWKFYLFFYWKHLKKN